MPRRRGGYASALEQTADLRKLCRACAYKLAAPPLLLTLSLSLSSPARGRIRVLVGAGWVCLTGQSPCRGNITQSTMFTAFENAMGPVTPHLTLVRSNRLEEGFLADRTEVGGFGPPAPIRNGFRVGPF